jgi:O-antigen ligase
MARLALGLSTAALVSMPLAMWLSSRSAPLVLAIAATGCIMALAREQMNEAAPTRNKWPISLSSPRAGMAFGLGGFLLMALVSILWSHDRLASLRAYGELVGCVGAGAVVAAVLPGRAPRWAGKALLGALLVASLLTISELQGLSVWRDQLGLRAETFVFNRTLICASLVAIPALAWLAGARRPVALAFVGGAVGAALLLSDSGAGKLGLAAAVAAGLLAWAAPRIALLAGAAGLVALFALAPVQGEIADRVIPSAAHRQLQDAHSRDRVDIWLAFGQAARARPLLGSGFGTSATLHRHAVATALPEAARPWLSVGHPHSAPLQIWAETGLAGAALLLLAGLNLLVLLMRMQPPWRIGAYAVFAAALAIAAVGHGAWQGWWIATLGASIAWFRVLMAQSRRDGLSGTGAGK